MCRVRGIVVVVAVVCTTWSVVDTLDRSPADRCPTCTTPGNRDTPELTSTSLVLLTVHRYGAVQCRMAIFALI